MIWCRWRALDEVVEIPHWSITVGEKGKITVRVAKVDAIAGVKMLLDAAMQNIPSPSPAAAPLLRRHSLLLPWGD